MKDLDGFIIALDFDGTVVTHRYPSIGDPVPGAIEKLQKFQERGASIVLNTMRSGATLVQAVSYLQLNGIELYGVNEHPTQHSWTKSPKVFAHIYIDDSAYGCPTTKEGYVDWSRVNL